MSLATVNDVARVLHLAAPTAAQDGELAEALEAAESWFRKRSKKLYDARGSQTLRVFDVAEQGRIELPVDAASILAVRVDGYATTYYDLIDNNTIRLRADLLVSPFAGAMARRYAGTHRAVEVDYLPSTEGVPIAVRDGIARLAGYLWITGPRPSLGDAGTDPVLQSESLGGYSYTVKVPEGASDGGDSASGFTDAMLLLRPFMRRARVSVT